MKRIVRTDQIVTNDTIMQVIVRYEGAGWHKLMDYLDAVEPCLADYVRATTSRVCSAFSTYNLPAEVVNETQALVGFSIAAAIEIVRESQHRLYGCLIPPDEPPQPPKNSFIPPDTEPA